MRTRSSQGSRRAGAIMLTCVVVALLALAGCGGGSSTTAPPVKAWPCGLPATFSGLKTTQEKAAALHDLRTCYAQQRANTHDQDGMFWTTGVIAVAVVSSGPLVAIDETSAGGSISHALNTTVFQSPAANSPAPNWNDNTLSVVPLAQGSWVPLTTTATIFLRLQGASDGYADLKASVDAINVLAAPLAVTIGPATVYLDGASPDWVTAGSPTGGGFIGGSPGGAPQSAETAQASSDTPQGGDDASVFVLDTADPWPAGTNNGPITCDTMVPGRPCPDVLKAWSNGLAPKQIYLTMPDEKAKLGTFANNAGYTAGNFKEHGLFATALVHHRAPQAQITLIRVLNDYAVGDLQSLVTGLRVAQASAHRTNAYVNLSLSVQPPAACMLAMWADGYSHFLRAGSSYELNPSACATNSLHAAPVLADSYQSRMLATVGLPTEDMVHAGYTLVAAAGNDLRGLPHMGADLPAAFCGVTAVAALASAGAGSSDTWQYQTSSALADFSNYPYIPDPAAAGDASKGTCLNIGVTRPGALSANELQQSDQRAQALGKGVCSLYLPSRTDGFGTWDGTSFATPLGSV